MGGRSMTDRSEHTDLSTPATELLAANALDALRGPMSRGAVPTASLADLVGRPRSSVARLIDRETGQHGATGFDLVVRTCFDTDRNGTRPRWEEALAAYVSSQGPPGLEPDREFTEPVLKRMMAEGFSSSGEGDSRTQVLVGYLLHCAALLHQSGGPGDCGEGGSGAGGGACHSGDESDRAAAKILELRSESYSHSTAVYTSALRFVLSAGRRRPKGDHSVEEIVVMLHSLFDGYYIRHALDPARYPLESLVDAIWGLTAAMTEPGFLAPNDGGSPVRDQLVELTLELVKKNGELPPLSQLAEESGLGLPSVTSEFPDEEQLVTACLESLCRHAIELRSLAGETVEIARWTIRGFLSWIASIVEDYGPLVRAAPDAKVWDELGSSLDMMLLSSSDKLGPMRRREIANKLLDYVRNGLSWEPALSVLLDVIEPEN